LFDVEKYHVSMRRDAKQSICEATVRVRVGKKVHDEVAEGDGPVNALDSALRSALAKSFPKLKKVTLTDYKVRILDGVAGTAAKTRAKPAYSIVIPPPNVTGVLTLGHVLNNTIQDILAAGAHDRARKCSGCPARITRASPRRPWWNARSQGRA
jgi:hypothetical protein